MTDRENGFCSLYQALFQRVALDGVALFHHPGTDVMHRVEADRDGWHLLTFSELGELDSRHFRSLAPIVLDLAGSVPVVAGRRRSGTG